MLYTMGESLMDVVEQSSGRVFMRPGGSQLNVAVSLARSGLSVSLISETGDDAVAERLLDFLKTNGVNTRFVKKYFRTTTSLALAVLDENKKPSYTFYKSYPRQRRLVFPQEFQPGDVLSFGSMYALDHSLRNELVQVLAAAKSGGALLVYDPNIRHGHHLHAPGARAALEENLSLAGLVKGSDEDFENIFGSAGPEAHWQSFRKLNPQAPLVITRGAAGVTAFFGEEKTEVPALKLEPLSTIGAGDAFTAGMLYELSRQSRLVNPLQLDRSSAKKVLETAMDFAARVCLSEDNYVPAGFTPER